MMRPVLIWNMIITYLMETSDIFRNFILIEKFKEKMVVDAI